MPTFTRTERIRGGGQGEVYKGTSEDGQVVAIKYLKPTIDIDGQGDELKRFEREIACQTSLDHPGIIKILTVDVTANPPYLVMPLAEHSLRDLLGIATEGLPEDQAVGVFSKILSAVAYAHSEGVLHRDLKPENILFLDGEPRISDFGLGRRLFSGSTTLTVTNAALGTLQYAAPEQLRDAHTVDVRADVFALGRIFYELLCGEMAFFALDLDKVPARYRHIILKATYNEPERRFSSVSEMAREIALLEGGDEWLQPSSERAATLITEIADGDSSRIAEFARLMVENPDDEQLYLRVFTFVPAPVLTQLVAQLPEDFGHIMKTFSDHAAGRHGFSFTDTLADFMVTVIRSTSSVDTREVMLRRLLEMGYLHNRWYVGGRFADMAVELSQANPMYSSIVAGLLRENPSAAQFVKGQMTSRSLPAVVVEALAA